MANFGERIAYWYLRLNGFFLVEDFVLHRADHGPRTADADFLGIRLRHSIELMDGAKLDEHADLRDALGGFDRNIGVVVQVKTGEVGTPGAAFDVARMTVALRFIGAAGEVAVGRLAEELRTRAVTDSLGGWRFAKVLIAEHPREEGVVAMPLATALDFIEDRLRRHADRKGPDRMFFGDELMQFLAWKAGQHRRGDG